MTSNGPADERGTTDGSTSGKQFERGTDAGDAQPDERDLPQGAGAAASGKRFERGTRAHGPGPEPERPDDDRQASGKEFERGTRAGGREPDPRDAPHGAGSSGSGKQFARGTHAHEDATGPPDDED